MARRWTPEEDAFLRANWETMSDQTIGEQLGRSKSGVAFRRQSLGLIGRPGERKADWGTEEENSLCEMWGYKTVPQVAKILGRSEKAILLKAWRLGLPGPSLAGEKMPLKSVADLMGVDACTVRRWIEKLGLKAQRIAMRGKRKMRMIRLNNLVAWLRDHPDEWDSRKMEKYALGTEPDWLKQKRETDALLPKKRFVRWTPEEDRLLVRMYKSGEMTRTEMGAWFDRSAGSIDRRLVKLDVWGSGEFIPKTLRQERQAKREEKTRMELVRSFRDLLLVRFNEMNFDGFWQKDMCMLWDPVKGCTAQEENCDVCASFQRIRPQYCARCGLDFLERKTQRFCPACRAARKKAAQKKYAVLHGRFAKSG